MEKKIACFLDEHGETSILDREGVVKVYERRKGEGWFSQREFPFNLDKTLGLTVMRGRLTEMAKALEDCSVFVAEEISGLVYNILDILGFSLWEMKGKPENFLEDILEKEEQRWIEMERDKVDTANYFLQGEREGCYNVNLKEIQKNDGEITSKQILLPFLKNSTFFELRVICAHIPPWFENEFERLKLKSYNRKLGEGSYEVIIHKRICED